MKVLKGFAYAAVGFFLFAVAFGLIAEGCARKSASEAEEKMLEESRAADVDRRASGKKVVGVVRGGLSVAIVLEDGTTLTVYTKSYNTHELGVK